MNNRHLYSQVAVVRSRRWAWIIIRALLVIGISFIIIYPLIVKFSISVMSRSDMNDVSVRWIAKNPTLTNYRFAYEAMLYPEALKGTLILCAGCTLLQMLSCCMAAYAFVKLRYPGSKLVFLLAVFTLVVPPQTYMIAMYSQMRFFDPLGILTALTGKEGIINTYWPFLLRSFCGAGIRNGLYIYLMTQFFRNIPKELEEAAYMDGASPLRIFFRVMLPNSVPILVTIAVFSFVWQWNDEFFASLFAPRMEFLSRNLYYINDKIRALSGAYVDDPGYTSILKNAASLLAVAPLMVVFIAAQRFFVQNFERSGIVG